MTLGSLFDGSGTAPLTATILGWTPVWASEIEPYPVAVTTARFPDMIHLGDITQINGAEIAPVDVIVGGSPCQDLSVAGKQAGLENGTRSNLFYEMTRIIREMRGVTNGKYPRFVVWENVPGAFSSNKGRDFHAVVQAFCAIAEDSVHVPEPEADKKTGRLTWKTAGAIVGDGWSFAWRVLDAQYWGVPQRRRRIFAVLDFGSERAGEILFERTRLPWDSEPCGASREKDTTDVVGCTDRGVGVRCLNSHDSRTQRIYDARGIYPTLCANATSGLNRQAVVYALQGNGIDRFLTAGCNGAGWREGEMYTLNTIDRPAVVYDARGNGTGDVAATITGDHQNRITDYTNVTCYQNTGRGWWNGCDTAQTLRTPCGGDATKANLVVATGQANAEIMEDRSPTLNAGHEQPILVREAPPARPPIRYIVRRLTPTECARLQGFPGWWTDGVPGTDSAKYKMWGNGMALPCMLAVQHGIDTLIR